MHGFNMIYELQSEHIFYNVLLNLLTFLKNKHYEFTVITPLTHQRILNRRKKPNISTISLRDIFGWNLPFEANDLESQLFSQLLNTGLISLQNGKYISQIRIASLADELFIHSAFPTDEQNAVFFGPDTYRFYYHLKQYLLNRKTPIHQAIELCCGTSAVALSIAKKFPSINQIITVDLNPKALMYSQIHKDFMKCKHILPIMGDLLGNINQKFDLIFANPPYIMDIKQRQYRHGGTALEGSEIAFKILEQGINKLTSTGSLFLYTGIAIDDQGQNKFLESLKIWIQKHPNFQYHYEEVDSDVFGEELDLPHYQHIERIAIAIILIEHK